MGVGLEQSDTNFIIYTILAFSEANNSGHTTSALASDSTSDALYSKIAFISLNLPVDRGFSFAMQGDLLLKGSEMPIERAAIQAGNFSNVRGG